MYPIIYIQSCLNNKIFILLVEHSIIITYSSLTKERIFFIDPLFFYTKRLFCEILPFWNL